MIYILFLIYTTFYLKLFKSKKFIDYKKITFLCLPIILLWIILIGSQYGVGTDYFTYLKMFDGSDLWYVEENRGEIIFSNFIKLSNFLGIYGQGVFYLIALIYILSLLFIISETIEGRYIFLFWIIFICLPGTFNNQMNGLRQYLAIYILTIAIIFLLKGNLKISLFLFFINGFIHQSSWLIVPLIFLIYILKNKLNNRSLLLIILIGLICSFIINNNFISLIIPYFDTYSHYMNTGMVNERTGITMITKYIYVPIFIWSILLIKKLDLSQLAKYLFIFGIVGFSLKLSLMSISLISRFGLYFEILSCYPIYFLFKYYYRRKSIYKYSFLLIYIICPYIAKVIYATNGEYSYDFFLLH